VETVLLGTDRGTGEANLLKRLLRNRRRSGRHRRRRDRRQPAAMAALKEAGSIHQRQILLVVVDVVLG